MEKDFDAWNEYKKKLDAKNHHVIFQEGEVWWCVVGINIGSEQNANPPNFIRPVYIFKIWSRNTFWGIPLTKQIKNHPSRFRISFLNRENDLLIDMLQIYDSKRLSHKMGILSDEIFDKITYKIHAVMPSVKSEIPLQQAGNFEGHDLSI